MADTKKEIIQKMQDEIPFTISNHHIPYIEEAMELYADSRSKLFIEELNKKIDWLHKQSLKAKGSEKKSYEDSVNSFVIFKMQIEGKLTLKENSKADK